jgi:isoleucyl-tRNA synthetase
MFLEKGKPFKLPEVEEKVLEFWKKEQIFEKSLARRKSGRPFGKAQGKTFVFYEGPPYANGRPGIHHVLARIYKDIILRFRSMRGYYVPRRGGWDTHGLPVEIAAEKVLGLKSKKEIEKFGIELFNQKAKEAVWKYKDEWESLTNRIGYWLDLKNAYVTYENDYVESLWWILKRLWDKKLLSQGHKVVPWCPRCGTALSSHELAQGYKEVKDRSIYVKFRLKPNQKFGKYTTQNSAYILSWTTTPWTLPGNVALAVGEKISYTALRKKGANEVFILASDLVPSVFKDEEIEIVHNDIKGRNLVGLEYNPLFNVAGLKSEKSYKVYGAGFVTTTDGTGVVHTAVMYGEDDYQLGLKIGLPQYHTVDEDGRFTSDVNGLKGLPVKDKTTEDKILEILEKNGHLLRADSYTHEYPFCWRCGTAVLYYARTSWFIAMSRLKSELLSRNQKINWLPAHVKDGRFGEWLREVKDWNLSRERYWGVPLPIWQCDKCHKTEVVGSIEELRSRSLLPNLIFVRHGEARHNVEKRCVSIEDTAEYTSHITERGKKIVRETAKILAKIKIDRIIASPLARSRETAAIISETTGAPVETRRDLIDINVGIFAGRPEREYQAYQKNTIGTLDKRLPEGESRNQVMARMVAAWKDIPRKYPGETIVVVSHGDPLWMLKRALELIPDEAVPRLVYPKTGKIYDIKIKASSFDHNGKLDLHRPFVDEIKFACEKCHGEMARIPEVADVWFDSGAMPFAQGHWPFAKNQKPKTKNQSFKLPREYPADYISEGMDQTRGWFYTLLAVATALGYPAPYKNVISLGLINDKNGQKMSKSKGNIVEPRSVIDAYGVDAVRWYFYTATPAGEPKNFDEQEVLKAARRYHLVLWNSYVFFDTYGPKKRVLTKPIGKKKSVLDRWIISRLEEVIEEVTAKLDSYDVREAALALEKFLDDFSRWYIRRSRRRLQRPVSQSDYKEASETLGQVLYVLAVLTSPFTPFFAEFLYHELFPNRRNDSVHFLNWPKLNKKLIDQKLIKEMAKVRSIAATVLAKRAELGLKVRQPLAQVKVNSGKGIVRRELLEILKDEVNVKEVIYDKKLEGDIWLDTTITEELRAEGLIRELIRQIQDLRQKAGLKPHDVIQLFIETDSESIQQLLVREEGFITREVRAKELLFKKKAGAMESPENPEGITYIGLKKL